MDARYIQNLDQGFESTLKLQGRKSTLLGKNDVSITLMNDIHDTMLSRPMSY
jgi:hypothetical protein